MIRRTMSLLACAALLVGVTAGSADFGTPAEAKAMLEKAAGELQKDKAKALDMFTKGDAGFKDRDLYPYCGGPDGKFTAHPKLVGQSLKELKDKTGKAFGEEIYKLAVDGKIAEVPYMWPRPNETEPVQKIAYVTKVGDQVCAVGYYK